MASLSPHELLARLAKGKPIPGILLVGSDSYLRDLCRKKLVDAYVAEGTRDWGVRKFSADEDDVSVDPGAGADHAHARATASDFRQRGGSLGAPRR